MASDPWPTIKNSLKKLREWVIGFNEEEEIITSKHDLWSIKKLVVLRYYLYPFLEILRNNDFKKIYYVDLFSGSGFLKIKGKIMPGTSLVALLTTKEFSQKNKKFVFDEYYLSDIKKTYVKALQERINHFSKGVSASFTVKQKDFPDAVDEIFTGNPPVYGHLKDNAYLVVLDPFGFQVDWAHLQKILQSGSVDIFITFPTTMASWNQNKEQSAESLTKMFGSNDWVTCDSEEAFLKLYCEKIEKVPVEWRQFKTTTLTVNTSNGRYHLICASRSPGADRIFSSMKKKFDEVDNALLDSVFDSAIRGKSTMDDFLGMNQHSF